MQATPYSLFSQDEDYLREIHAGGASAEAAISMLYRKYRKRVLKTLKAFVKRYPQYNGTAEDAMHDAFLVLVQKIQYNEFVSKYVHGFWIGVGKKLVLNQLKKDQRYVCLEESDEVYGIEKLTPEELVLTQEEEEKWLSFFSRLGHRCRQILLLWIDQYSMPEIAQKLELSSPAMARKHKHECFKKLKEMISAGNKIPG